MTVQWTYWNCHWIKQIIGYFKCILVRWMNVHSGKGLVYIIVLLISVLYYIIVSKYHCLCFHNAFVKSHQLLLLQCFCEAVVIMLKLCHIGLVLSSIHLEVLKPNQTTCTESKKCQIMDDWMLANSVQSIVDIKVRSIVPSGYQLYSILFCYFTSINANVI